MADIYVGEVRNGVVVFEGELPPFPEGTKVRVEPFSAEGQESSTPTLAERLGPVIGSARGLPSDLAAQHDHYLHGLPKR
jgi:hypothetical protein